LAARFSAWATGALAARDKQGSAAGLAALVRRSDLAKLRRATGKLASAARLWRAREQSLGGVVASSQRRHEAASRARALEVWRGKCAVARGQTAGAAAVAAVLTRRDAGMAARGLKALVASAGLRRRQAAALAVACALCDHRAVMASLAARFSRWRAKLRLWAARGGACGSMARLVEARQATASQRRFGAWKRKACAAAARDMALATALTVAGRRQLLAAYAKGLVALRLFGRARRQWATQKRVVGRGLLRLERAVFSHGFKRWRLVRKKSGAAHI